MSELKKPAFDNLAIRNILVHRYPFLLIDQVLEKEDGPDKSTRKGNRVIVKKNVTANEPFFTGHFPNNPIMPGVLQIEAMAQAGGMACYRKGDEGRLELVIASISNAKFRRPVVPGDTLMIHAEVLKDRGSMVVIGCKTFVESELVSQVEILSSFLEKNTLAH